MAHHILLGFNDQLGPWFHARIPWWPDYDPKTRQAQYVGVADGPNPTDNLLCVWAYFEFKAPQDKPIALFRGQPWGGTCQIAAVAASPRWAVRGTIARLLSIPFLEYNCRKIEAVIPSTNARSIRVAEGIGLRPEGTLRHHFAKGVHASVHGMMRQEFQDRWVNRTGKRRATPAQAATHGRSIFEPDARTH